MRHALENAGHDVQIAADATSLLARVADERFDIVFVDAETTVDDPIDIVSFVRQSAPDTDIVILAEVGQLPLAAASIRRGATLYLIEPLEPSAVLAVIDSSLKRLSHALVVREVDTRTVDGFFGHSPAMSKLVRLIRKVAPTDATVLLTGESGTGKEVVANIIHRLSPRGQSGKMVPVNCGAIPENLLESELFGHMKGAFTCATQEKEGLLHEADRGTCFLDEIAEMPMQLQVKLLRFLQDRLVRRVGAVRSEKVDVRILAATNKNLLSEMASGRFREDLFFRLNVVQIYLPPLRERQDTIPFLVGTFLTRFVRQYRKQILGISAEAQSILMTYHYPGNIRELENILEYGCIMADGRNITEADLPPHVLAGRSAYVLPEHSSARDTAPLAPPAADEEPRTLAQMEADHIRAMLARCGGNQTMAAKLLGISRTSLWRKMQGLKAEA
ncbi:MAG: sigma-54-dependent Fis family transcriptional regulator [Candidatus Wallbacteria bacterium]|nr:sigma-54-dependent Fis family transcriptional regulator [Candidatus Wallbacteria bacterium]